MLGSGFCFLEPGAAIDFCFVSVWFGVFSLSLSWPRSLSSWTDCCVSLETAASDRLFLLLLLFLLFCYLFFFVSFRCRCLCCRRRIGAVFFFHDSMPVWPRRVPRPLALRLFIGCVFILCFLSCFVIVFVSLVLVRVQEQMIRHAGARKARGVEGSGVEGRGGRRRSRSFAGPGSSPRVSASSPLQPGGSTGAASTGKRKRSPSNAVSSGTGVNSSSEAPGEEGEEGAAAALSAAAAAEEGEDEEAAEERERQAEEEREAEVSAARPALVFCRVVDALQAALKPRQDAAVAAAAAAAGGQEAIVLDIFLSGGDDLLLAASRAAHEAYERAVRPVGSGGGVVEVLGAMGLEQAFARWVWRGEERKEKGGKEKRRGEKEVASACRERVMNLLCEGDLLAVAGYRTSA